MATHASALKAHRQSLVHRERNRRFVKLFDEVLAGPRADKLVRDDKTTARTWSFLATPAWPRRTGWCRPPLRSACWGSRASAPARSCPLTTCRPFI